jgi:hypothetical protein
LRGFYFDTGGEGGILRHNTKSAFSFVNYSVYLRTCVENMW